jgi:hypothetical protein
MNRALLVCLLALRGRIGSQPQRDVLRLHRLLGILLATNKEHKQEVSESYPKQENEYGQKPPFHTSPTVAKFPEDLY